ncbi:hypothetical protein BJY04DRAFT_231138 [Aspergillus karnatakaensis]|uniref:Zn(II)2Cys6 transcription factor n=1 Tax=Aspergillus karnatakaensis TaxID=1810916 RepID=UPI003CCDE4C2
MLQPQPKRKRAFTKRSRTGCRTCRIRHVKCDETPGACRNCSSNGWTCEGYEVNRLPRRTEVHHSSSDESSFRSITPPLATGFRWATTADEKRCVNFFLYRTIPGITSFYDSSLWQKLILQMSCTEPAVYHAVVALSAINQHLERDGIPIPGSNAESTWYRFALEQSMRSFGLLNKRHILKDPQLREVLLVCCLLFIMLELVCGHYDDATVHLRSGLAILKEMKIQRHRLGASLVPVEESLLEAFLHLEAQATHHGVMRDGLRLDNQLILENQYELCLYEFKNLHDAQQAFNPLMNTVFPFLERCWSRPEAEIMANYGTLHAKQQRLFSCVNQYGTFLYRFRERQYHRLNAKQQRAADMIRLNHMTLDLNLKTCLYTRGCPEPVWFIDDYKDLMAESLAVMERFKERPLMTIDAVITPALFTVGARCPDYSLRYEAVDALRAWPRCEGYLNSLLIADLVEEGMRAELRHLWSEIQTGVRSTPPGLYFEEQKDGGVVVRVGVKGSPMARYLALTPNAMLRTALMSVQSSPYWTCVRATGLLPATGKGLSQKKFLEIYDYE